MLKIRTLFYAKNSDIGQKTADTGKISRAKLPLDQFSKVPFSDTLPSGIQWLVQITNSFIFWLFDINNELSQSLLFRDFFQKITEQRTFYTY